MQSPKRYNWQLFGWSTLKYFWKRKIQKLFVLNCWWFRRFWCFPFFGPIVSTENLKPTLITAFSPLLRRFSLFFSNLFGRETMLNTILLSFQLNSSSSIVLKYQITAHRDKFFRKMWLSARVSKDPYFKPLSQAFRYNLS